MRKLSDEDIQAIMVAIHSVDHPRNCRFSQTTPEDMEEAIEFFRTFNTAWNESKSTIRKTLIVILVTFISGMMGAGIIVEIGKVLKGDR